MKPGTIYNQGDLILVPFPFTDLSAAKRRPAVVVSPDPFNQTSQDAVLVAVTSQVAPLVSEMELTLTRDDIAFGRIPRPSIIKLAKLFTMHQRLIVKRVARLREQKLAEVLDRLSRFFSPRSQLTIREASSSGPLVERRKRSRTIAVGASPRRSPR